MSDEKNLTAPVLATGATGGLGPAVVERLRAAGCDVRVLALQGGDIDVDLTDPAAARAAVTSVGDRLGGVVCLAGGYAAGGLAADAPEGELERMLALNLRTVVHTLRPALPALVANGGGSVVCVGTRAIAAPFAGASAYIASKAAVVAYAHAVAADYKADGVRVNAILPGMIDTPANRAAMPDAIDAMTPPERIADVIAWLVAGPSHTVTGAAIPV